MPTILDSPPPNVQDDLDALVGALNDRIPQKTDSNLLVATWNIRAFGSLTRKWMAGSNDSPKRDLRGLRAVIEILSRFDVVAIQEVKGNLRALRDTMRFLGTDWGFLMTDVNAGSGGNDERLAFLFDRRRVKPSGLAAELVVPSDRLAVPGAAEDEGTATGIGVDALREQFVRSPYAVSFVRGSTTFILVTLHVLFGDREEDRLAELQQIAEWMQDWAKQSNRFHHNLLVLGDFNIDRHGSDGYEAFVSTGLTVPEPLINLPRTIFDDPGEFDDDKFYDQIAWFVSGENSLIDLKLLDGGNLDFLPYVYRDTALSRFSVSFRVSDHLPLWVEFGV
jgi:endonuclease/exonuclease/phosphatase family metal-dependent hydrolase